MATYYVSSDGTGDGSTSGVPMSPTDFKDYMETAGTYNAAAGDLFYIKAGTYTWAASVTPVNDGTAITPIRIVGCDSSWNPIYPTRTNGSDNLSSSDVPVFAFNSTYRWAGSGADYIVYSGLRITGSVSNELFTTGANCVIYKCYAYNSSTNANAAAFGVNYTANSVYYDCDAELASTGGNAGFVLSGAGNRVIGSKVITSATIGISLAANNLIVSRCWMKIAGIGLKCAASTGNMYTILDNTIISTGSKAIELPDSAWTILHVIAGNHLTDNGSYGVDSLRKTTDERCAFFAHNRLRDNVSSPAIDGFDNWLTATGFGHVTTDSGDYTTDYSDFSTGDLRLISTAAGKGVGHPSYMDIGALQRQESGGGGGQRVICG